VKAACCDTSFLVALYGRDGHTAKAEKEAALLQGALRLTAFNEFEFSNTLRLLCFRGLLSDPVAASMTSLLETDIAAGKTVLESCNLAQVLAEAKRISSLHSRSGAHRGFDIFHVAAAVHLKADLFLSFDANQRKLAAKEGLVVGP